MRPRSAAVSLPQPVFTLARAAWTAASMSLASLRCSSSKTCPSDGSSTGMLRPEALAMDSLAMKLHCMVSVGFGFGAAFEVEGQGR